MTQFRSLGRTMPPCKGCQVKDHPACKSYCEDYLTYQKKHKEEVEMVRKKKHEEKLGYVPWRTDREFKNAMQTHNKNRVFKQTIK